MEQTNDGKKGGLLDGDKHSAPSGGIKAVVVTDNNKPVLLEDGEVIINSEAVKKNWKELNEINQSAGNGVPIAKPVGGVAKKGGVINNDQDTYLRWKSLVNMSASELKSFMDSEEGKKAGMTKEEADKLGIHNGQESARWIIKMKNTPVKDWTPKMWEWANRQISFNSRMIGNKGPLFDENGNKTRKHLSLLIWGHNPQKFDGGGSIKAQRSYLGESGGSLHSSHLEQAKLLHEQNKDYSHTGWFINPHDDMWRFEISDKEMEIKPLAVGVYKLSDIISHPNLFKSYPDFKNITLEVVDDSNMNGAAHVDTENETKIKYNIHGERGIAAEYTRRNIRIDARQLRKNIFVHELQHLIQIREKLGGGCDQMWQFEQILYEQGLEERGLGKDQRDILWAEAEKRRLNSSGEIEARDSASRMNLTDSERSAKKPLSSVNIDEKYLNVRIEMNTGGSITNTELDKALSDLHKAETTQATMKSANAIIRSKKDVTARLIKLGLSEAQAEKLQTPDFAKRIGFPTYALTNNNASIKRLQDRVNMLEKKVAGAIKSAEGQEEKYKFDGGTIEVNYPIDRVQILFPGGRVDRDIYAKLRKNGWVYSPTNLAFQRKITPQAISNAVHLFGAKRVGEIAKEEKSEDYESMLQKRNFSYVNIYISKALPKGYTGPTHFNLVVFELRKDLVVGMVKDYLKEHVPGLDVDKVEVSVYPKTYIQEAKILFKEGAYLPSAHPVNMVLGNLPHSVKNFLAMQKDISIREPEEPQSIRVAVVPEKKYVTVSQSYFAEKRSIGQVLSAPNMFVKEVYFGKDKTGKDLIAKVDNNYITKMIGVPEIVIDGKSEKFVFEKAEVIPHNFISAPKEIYQMSFSEFLQNIKLRNNSFGENKSVEIIRYFPDNTTEIIGSIKNTDSENKENRYVLLQLEKFHWNKCFEAINQGLKVPKENIDFYNSSDSLLNDSTGSAGFNLEKNVSIRETVSPSKRYEDLKYTLENASQAWKDTNTAKYKVLQDEFEALNKQTNNLTKNQIKDVISGKIKVSNGSAIEAATSYLKRSEITGSGDKKNQHYKKDETAKLKSYISENNLWTTLRTGEYIDEGAEQTVYLIDDKTVLKFNSAIFYNSWEDYFNNLLLHNFFFPDTAYDLVGFNETDGILYAVLNQSYIKKTSETDLNEVKAFMSENGFVNTKNNDYYNSELELILEDLHEGNVLTREGVLYFIDTVFYNQQLPEKKLIPVTEEILLPNTPDEFDEAIMSQIEPHDAWIGSLIKERDVKQQIYKQINHPLENKQPLSSDIIAEKQAETDRIFELYKARESKKSDNKSPQVFKNMGDYKVWIEEKSGKGVLELTEDEIINHLKALQLGQLVGTGTKKDRIEKAAQMLVYQFSKNVPDNELTLEQYAIKKFIGRNMTEAMVYSKALYVDNESFRKDWEKTKNSITNLLAQLQPKFSKAITEFGITEIFINPDGELHITSTYDVPQDYVESIEKEINKGDTKESASEKKEIFDKLEKEGKAHRIMKKEGDEDYVKLNNAPIITSSQSGILPLYRQDAKLFLTENFLNKYITNNHSGEKIFFTKISINELLQHTGPEKIRALFHIEEIVANATPSSVEEITTFNNPLKRESDFIYNMESIVMVDGQWFEYSFKTFVKLNDSKTEKQKITIYSGHLPKEKPI